MYYSQGNASTLHLLHLLIVTSFIVCSHGNDFNQKFVASWGERNVQIQAKGVLALSLDKEIGSRIESKERYLYGRFDMEMKLARGESAGTITSFYVKFSYFSLVLSSYIFNSYSVYWIDQYPLKLHNKGNPLIVDVFFFLFVNFGLIIWILASYSVECVL
jgi:Glycosyl hydrolases family 16